MHGRLKIRSSAEEAERRRNEQREKVKMYRGAMSKIFEKRASNEFDSEMMSLTASVLQRNPDISTLWNIRREYFLKLKEENSEDLQTLLDKELSLTEACLYANPKSYCIFHQRCWIMENSEEPNWKREVDLCTRYLDKDERNFHVWDYRRYVADRANIPPIDELEFCTEKIKKNFSNHSSWHSRIKLLPILYPHENDKNRPISETALHDELELSLTAAFVDPKDSSAWFYQRWLLGNSEQELDIVAFKLTKTFALLAFSKPVDLHKCSVSLDAMTKFDTFKWHPLTDIENQYNYVWKLEDTFELNNDSESIFELIFMDEKGENHSLRITKNNNVLFGIKKPKFGYEFGENITSVLREQLQSVQELIETDDVAEDRSKWTLLTAALLMRAIDREQYHTESLQFLETLKEFDSLRKGYYIDLSNKWSVEDRLSEWISTLEANQLNPLDLSNLNLNEIHYRQYFCVADQVNLNGNNFNSKHLGDIKVFLENSNVKLII